MKRTLEKETDGRPFVVCIDLNLPTDHGGDANEWIAELHRNVLVPFGREETGEPGRFSAVFFTTIPGIGMVASWPGSAQLRDPRP